MRTLVRENGATLSLPMTPLQSAVTQTRSAAGNGMRSQKLKRNPPPIVTN